MDPHIFNELRLIVASASHGERNVRIERRSLRGNWMAVWEVELHNRGMRPDELRELEANLIDEANGMILSTLGVQGLLV